MLHDALVDGLTSGQAEVPDLVPSLVDHDVRRLQVAVDDVVLTQILKPTTHLRHHLYNLLLLLLHRLLIRLITVLKHVPQIPTFTILRHDIKESIILHVKIHT